MLDKNPGTKPSPIHNCAPNTEPSSLPSSLLGVQREAKLLRLSATWPLTIPRFIIIGVESGLLYQHVGDDQRRGLQVLRVRMSDL